MKKTKGTESAPEPEMMDYSQFASTGFESVSHDDLGIPFLTIIQKGSPEYDESNPEYETYKIPDVKPGCIVQTLSREILYSPKNPSAPLEFIPCFYQKLFVEWQPRDKGGGIVRSHANPAIIGECTRNEKNQDVLRNGNIIVTTSYFFGNYRVMSDEPEYAKAIISMTSTQLKKARLWLNMMHALRVDSPRGKIMPPMFSHQYLISTVAESNEKGSWMGWKIDQGGPVREVPLIKELAEFSVSIRETQSRLLLSQGGDAPAIPV